MEKTPQGAIITREAADITQVVIHTMLSSFQFNVNTSWRTSTSGQGCFKPHYAVRNDGVIAQVVPERLASSHANAANRPGVGIEHDGFADDPSFYTEAMYAASAALTRDICGRHGIPMNRLRIIGHEEVHNASHGDPGGYWDWDYYLALVQWNGDPNTRPIRIIVDSTSPTTGRTGTRWTAVNRVALSSMFAPSAAHSWSTRSFQAAPVPVTVAAPDAAFFLARVPVTGSYEISSWWPVAPANNSETAFVIATGNPPNPILGGWVNQADLKARTRTTRPGASAPDWFLLGRVPLQAGDVVWVVIFQSSRKSGLIRADAVRFLKRY
jgi:N-acetylmuramoyl-L-alanine amidase